MQKVRWVNYGSSWPDGHRECTKCEKIKSFRFFHKHTGCKFGVNSVCKDCRKTSSRKHYENTTIAKRLFDGAKSRAASKGLDFNITLEDIVIPKTCPILHVELVYKTEYSPTLDRFDSAQGYIKGNVNVLSKRANMLKNNGTVAEFKAILEYLDIGG